MSDSPEGQCWLLAAVSPSCGKEDALKDDSQCDDDRLASCGRCKSFNLEGRTNWLAGAHRLDLLTHTLA